MCCANYNNKCINETMFTGKVMAVGDGKKIAGKTIPFVVQEGNTVGWMRGSGLSYSYFA